MLSGNEPSLIEVLAQAYRHHETFAADGRAFEDPQRAAIDAFVAFCKKYLDENRPVELSFAEANYRVRLANNVLCLISPDVNQQPGEMQPSNAVLLAANAGRYGRDMQPANAVQITGDSQKTRMR